MFFGHMRGTHTKEIAANFEGGKYLTDNITKITKKSNTV